MSNLHRAIRLLHANLQRALDTDDAWDVNMTRIEDIARKLAEKADRQMQPEGIDGEQLLQKIREHKELTYREKRAIPFVLFRDTCSTRLVPACLKAMDFEHTGQVRRLFYAYLSEYEEDKQKQSHRKKLDVVEAVLQSYFQKTPQPPYVNRLLAMGYRYGKPLLFGPASTTSMAAMMIKCKSVHACYETLGLPRGLYGCAYLREALRKFFLLPQVSVAMRFRFLDELVARAGGGAEHSGDVYADVYPAAATGLILGVDAMKIAAKKQPYKKKCLDLFYDLLGDPRFGPKTIRWESVSKKARGTFLSWLAENNLNLFFRIIEKTAVDAMWSYRKSFWEHYLPYISNTWVFFGREAAFLAQETEEYHKSAYGLLGKGCTTDQSAFAFQIGPYVFVEWSHNGSLRVWRAADAPDVFGVREVDKAEIVSTPCETYWRHAGKENYRWQSHVSLWLYQHCKIQ